MGTELGIGQDPDVDLDVLLPPWRRSFDADIVMDEGGENIAGGVAQAAVFADLYLICCSSSWSSSLGCTICWAISARTCSSNCRAGQSSKIVSTNLLVFCPVLTT